MALKEAKASRLPRQKRASRKGLARVSLPWAGGSNWEGLLIGSLDLGLLGILTLRDLVGDNGRLQREARTPPFFFVQRKNPNNRKGSKGKINHPSHRVAEGTLDF